MPDDLAAQVAVMQERLKQTAKGVDELRREIIGPTGDPDRKPVRVRLHELENDENAARAATAALEAIKAANAAEKTQHEAQSARRDRRIAIGVSLLIAALTLLPHVHLFG